MIQDLQKQIDVSTEEGRSEKTQLSEMNKTLKANEEDIQELRTQAESMIAANEAEKSSNITLVDVKAVGAFGRLTLAGREGDVEEAAAAAMRAIEMVNRNASYR